MPGYNAHRIFNYAILAAIAALAWHESVNLKQLLALGIGSLLDFENLFLGFHLIAFSNEFWSAEGYMLLLTPGGFWYDMFIYGTLFAVALSLIPGVLGGVYLLRLRRKKK